MSIKSHLTSSTKSTPNLLRNTFPKHYQLNLYFSPLSIQITYTQSTTDRINFDMSSNVLADKDINASATTGAAAGNSVKDVKSMEYHRQVLQSKLEDGQYVTPISNPAAAPLQTQVPLLTNPLQRKANLHLTFRQHHESLYCKAERLPE